MFEEINKDREAHGKKPFDHDSSGEDSDKPEMMEKTVSTTDPECGVFHKGEHKKVFAYEAHTACDKHNFILGVHVTPGNVHDSVAFDPLYDYLCQYYPEHKTVAADSAYKTPWICKRIFESGRVLTSAYTRPKTKAGNHPWHTPMYRDIYKLRKEKIERVFAYAKEKYGMRYTQYRGLTQVTNWVKLKATPHNSSAALAMSFPPSAACKFLDLPPVNLRNLHLHLTKNPFASRLPHCAVLP